MDFAHRTGHVVPVVFHRVETKLWSIEEVQKEQPTIVFRIRSNTLSYNLLEITDMIVTCFGTKFGIEFARSNNSIDPNKLVMDADSFTKTVSAWHQATSSKR